MKLESQVVNLELSKKLKELGVKQESLFYHVQFQNREMAVDKYDGIDYYQEIRERWNRNARWVKIASAFTVAELLKMRQRTVVIYGSTKKVADYLAREIINEKSS